jgi:multidrug transporter EmrE-like cation transporter
MYLLSKYDLGYIIPLTTALVYMIIFVASYLIFKETFTILKIVGITLIMVGLMLLNIKK